MKKQLALLALAGLLLAGSATRAAEPVSPQPARPLTYAHEGYQKITPAEARVLLAKGAVLIDVRSPEEYRAGHVRGAVNVPLETIRAGGTLAAAPDKGAPLLVQCKTGVRAEMAAKRLIESGYKKVYNIYGTDQWPYGLTTG